MHAIKRQARHLAHRRDDSKIPFWVPFYRQFTPPASSHGDSTDLEGNHDSKETSRELDEPVPDSPQQPATGAGPVAENQPKRRIMGGLLGKHGKDEQRPGVPRQSSTASRRRMHKTSFPIMQQLKAIFWTPVNILLVCVPIGIAFGAIKGPSEIAIFVVNFLAIVPLAGLLSYATEELAMRVGETMGGLLNASFGNAVELITAVIALTKNQIVIVKTSLIGSMLSNLLLVLGMCFFFGGWKRDVQHFNVTVAQTAASLLALAVGSILIPTFFDQGTETGAPADRVPPLSNGVAVILLFVYFCYLYFQLKTHKNTYNEPSEKSPKVGENRNNMSRGVAMIGFSAAPVPGNQKGNTEGIMKNASDDEELVEVPKIHVITAVILLVVSTAFVGACSEFLVDAIPAITRGGGVSEEFVGLILLPIVGNAAEHATAITVAIKDKMDLAIGVAIGSSLQIALLILPIAQVIGWGLGNLNMTLEFDVFLIGLLFVSILLVNYLIGDGESHWLEGVMLMSMYVLIAVAAWFYPADPSLSGE